MTFPMLPAILAQVPEATRSELSSWIISAAAVVVIAYYIVQLIHSFRPTPPLEKRYPSRDAHEATVAAVADLEKDCKQSEQRNREDHREIFELQRNTAQQLAATTALQEAHARQLIHLEEKVDQHIARPHKFQ